jgi:hypothetical protein
MAGLVVYSSPDTHLTVLEIPPMETDVSVSVPTECFRRAVDMLELADTLVSIHGTVAKVTLEAARKGVSASVSFGATEVRPCPAPSICGLHTRRPNASNGRATRGARSIPSSFESLHVGRRTRSLCA